MLYTVRGILEKFHISGLDPEHTGIQDEYPSIWKLQCHHLTNQYKSTEMTINDFDVKNCQ